MHNVFHYEFLNKHAPVFLCLLFHYVSNVIKDERCVNGRSIEFLFYTIKREDLILCVASLLSQIN